MKKIAFSLVAEKDKLASARTMLANLQRDMPNVKFSTARVQDDKEDVLYLVYAENLMPNEPGRFARRFINNVEDEEGGLTPILTFKEYPSIKSRDEFMRKVDKYHDESCKVMMNHRNWSK